jgi:hypothetical protein
MSAIRPKLGIELPSGHSSYGTRKHSTRMLDECHGAGIGLQTPSYNTNTLIHILKNGLTKMALLPSSDPRFKLVPNYKHTHYLDPPSPSFHFPGNFGYFFRQPRMRIELYQANGPPPWYDIVPERKSDLRQSRYKTSSLVGQIPQLLITTAIPWFCHLSRWFTLRLIKGICAHTNSPH